MLLIIATVWLVFGVVVVAILSHAARKPLSDEDRYYDAADRLLRMREGRLP